MKSTLFVVLLVAAAINLVCESPLQAASTKIWNTGGIAGISHNAFPHIAGECLVWQAHGALEGTTSGPGDWEIFLYNISTKTITQITDDDYDDISPQTDGDYVVWQKHDPTRTNQVFLYKLLDPPGGSMISNDDDKDNYSPQIAAGRVVWTSQRVAHSFEPGEIVLYDAKTATGPESISGTTLDCSAPRINSETVIWIQATESGTTALYIYDLTTGNTTSAPEGYVWPDSPQSDGGLTVLTRYDGSDREIFVYNNCARTYEQITDNGLEDTYPRISGNYAVWVRGEGEASEVVLASGLPVVPCADAGYDVDGDGVCGDVDNCPSTPNPGQEDSDADGVGDVCDSCPNDPNKTDPGTCGCGVADTDSDRDGVLDCNDGCPNDPNKTDPGTCGCSVPDTDSDGDGVLDCNDGCPNDPNKTDPGTRGCGVADTDSDRDGTPDCNDNDGGGNPDGDGGGLCFIGTAAFGLSLDAPIEE